MAESDRPRASPRAPELLTVAADAARLARERIESGCVDLFLPVRSRLSDYQRVTAGRLLDRLVAGLEGDLRARAAPALKGAAVAEATAAIVATRVPIAAPILVRAGALRDPELIALLLRRADEHRLTTALRLAAEAGSASIERWLRSGDDALAEAISALLIAESRRIGPAQDPLVTAADLPSALYARLLWSVAAALRHHLCRAGVVEGAVDHALSAAVGDALAMYDPNGSAAKRAMRVEVLLGDRLDDAALVALVEEGQPLLASASLAARAGVAIDDAMEMVADGGARLALLSRAAGVEPQAASTLLMRVALAIGGDAEETAARVEALATLTVDQAQAAIARWRVDSLYRAAIERIEAGLQRDVPA